MSIERIKIWQSDSLNDPFDFRVGDDGIQWIAADSNFITIEFSDKSVMFPMANVWHFSAYKKGHGDSE